MGEFHGEEVVPKWLRQWQATLFDRGWMIPAYGPELGGRNCTPVQTLIFLETMAGRRIPCSGHFPGYAIVAPSLLEFGNDAQRQLAPAAIRGDTIWCIGMSEPNAGSDLAGLQTRAEVFDDRFVVNGQKVWTSYAQIAQKCFCYVRTDPTVAKHRGISLLIVDMDTPGIEVRPLSHLSRKADFAEVFFTDVEVPRDNLVGVRNGGRALTQGSLAHERAGPGSKGCRASSRPCRRWSTSSPHRPRPTTRSCAARSPRPTSSRRVCARSATRDSSFAQGSSAPEHSYMKMATSEAGKAAFELGMDICGPYGAVTRPGSRRGRRPLDHELLRVVREHDRRRFVGDPTNIIAQRVLGLPRG